MTLIEELERLRDEATPGPWEAHQGIDDAAPSVWDITSRHNHTDYGETPKGWFLATVHEVVSEESAANDAALIVALVNNLDTIIAALKAAEWRPIEEARYNTLYQIRAGHMEFPAKLFPEVAINDANQSCDQWIAEHEGEHPPCWSGGACWANNEDEVPSLQPTHFRPLGPGPEGEE